MVEFGSACSVEPVYMKTIPAGKGRAKKVQKPSTTTLVLNGVCGGGKRGRGPALHKGAFERDKLQKRGAALSRQILNNRGPLSLPPPKGPDGGVFARRGRVEQNALELYTQNSPK